MSMKLLRIIILCFNIISELMIRYFEFVSYWTSMGLEYFQYLPICKLQEILQFS